MWTERVGAEVMKPLATPVLGGMVSSLLYVLIVTPVLFYWIHERRLRVASVAPAEAAGPLLPSLRGTRPTYETREDVGRVARSEGRGGPGTPSDVGRVSPGEDTGGPGIRTSSRLGVRAFAASLMIVALAGAGWWLWTRQAQPQPANDATRAVLETIRSGDLVVSLSNPEGQLRAGTNQFRIEFRSAATNQPVDVGTVELAASMTMPGMVMTGPVTITSTGQPGVYDATGNFGMSGSWQMAIEWNGPAGRGSAAFEGNVQ
jgi:hypothetical protein